MKFRFSTLSLVPVAFLAAVSCNDKQNTSSDEAKTEEKSVVQTVAEKAKEVIPALTSNKLGAEERAAKLGFAQYLAQDTEMLLSIYNAEQAAEQFQALDLYKLFVSGVQGEGISVEIDEPLELEDEDSEEELTEVEVEPDTTGDGPNGWTLLGREITIGLGKNSIEQAGHLTALNQRVAFFRAKALGRAIQEFAKTGDADRFVEMFFEELQGGGVMLELLKDSETGTELLDKLEMPPLAFAFRAKEGELDQAAQLIASNMEIFEMGGDMAKEVDVEVAGSQFSGYKIIGKELASMLDQSRDGLEDTLGADTLDSLIGTIAKKDIFAVSGTVGEYVVLMLAGSEEELKLVTDTKDSLAATDKLAFVDSYADKQLLSVSYGNNEVWQEWLADMGGISPYALGLRDGIAEGENLGDTRDLEEMLQIVVDREKALLALGSSSDFGLVAYTEEGLKVETYGGYDNGAADWDTDARLAHLGNNDDQLLFINSVGNEEYAKKMTEYAEAIFETAYAFTMKLSTLGDVMPEVEMLKQYTQLFDAEFRKDLVGIYEALSGNVAEGLGEESAIIIDFNGAVPAVPGIPQTIVDEGKAPRIALLAPVKDRSKLVSAWEAMNKHSTSILAKISEMTDESIPMIKPMSSDSDGAKTWFFSMPFFEDNFLPSVTVSDDWFAASTSKDQALDLIGKAKAGGKAEKGFQFHLNVDALTKYAKETLAMIEKNSEELFPQEHEEIQFQESKEQIKQVIEACRQFEFLNWKARKDGGMLRNSLHFKTR